MRYMNESVITAYLLGFRFQDIQGRYFLCEFMIFLDIPPRKVTVSETWLRKSNIKNFTGETHGEILWFCISNFYVKHGRSCVRPWSIWHSYDCSISWPDHRYSRNEGTADQIKACSIHRINTAYDIKNKDIQKRLLYYKNKDIDSTNISETVL